MRSIISAEFYNETNLIRQFGSLRSQGMFGMDELEFREDNDADKPILLTIFEHDQGGVAFQMSRNFVVALETEDVAEVRDWLSIWLANECAPILNRPASLPPPNRCPQIQDETEVRCNRMRHCADTNCDFDYKVSDWPEG
jgi:hypothetical protein